MDLEAVFEHLECLRGKPRRTIRLDGGLTNRNFRVTTEERDVVVRLSSSEDSAVLAIDRDAEYASSCAAAEAGAAPSVIEYVPEHHVLVVEYIDGHTFTEEDLHDPVNIRRTADVCRTLHAGPRFPTNFDMFDVQAAYLTTVRQRGFRLPERYLEFAPQLDRIRAALTVRGEGTVPCNNDLLAANIIDDGERLWLIDYEYAGNNDPCFELGNLASESHLSTRELTQLVSHYYGQELRHKVARARLLGLMSNYGWTLWASIQDATSPLDFDFWSWGMDKYDRAVETFDGPDFDDLLSEAQRPD
jgi:thiamine kinase-like enzyme